MSPIICGSVPSILKIKRGAILLLVDDVGFDLAYPDGRQVRTTRSDSRLQFELIGCSNANPSKLRTPGLPYSITVRGANSLLSNEAYSVIIREVANRGLVDSIARGSRWVYTLDASPMIHHIRAPSATR